MVFLIVELLFFIVEYPIGCGIAWFAFNAMVHQSIIGVILWTLLTPVIGIVLLLAYLFLGSQSAAGETRLDDKFKDWIVIKDPAL